MHYPSVSLPLTGHWQCPYYPCLLYGGFGVCEGLGRLFAGFL